MPFNNPLDDPLEGRRGVLFDLDGVLTPTSDIHRLAWARLFEPYLAGSGAAPYQEQDYFDFIDGKPRYEGVRSMLEARGITIPEGTSDDDPSHDTVCGLGNRKDATVNRILREEGVIAYPGSVLFLDAMIAAGRSVAVVSSSRNAHTVLAAAGLADRFTVVVDGILAAEHNIAGKPAPDTYLYAAEQLGLAAADCAVVEDAHSGVQAGRAGDFGLVLGIDRGAGAQALLDSGADLVVHDLVELLPPSTHSRK
ncbi:MAG: HAD family hydrolase [Rhodoglobus sp.]